MVSLLSEKYFLNNVQTNTSDSSDSSTASDINDILVDIIENESFLTINKPGRYIIPAGAFTNSFESNKDKIFFTEDLKMFNNIKSELIVFVTKTVNDTCFFDIKNIIDVVNLKYDLDSEFTAMPTFTVINKSERKSYIQVNSKFKKGSIKVYPNETVTVIYNVQKKKIFVNSK